MDELVRWLGEQLDEDERIARAADSSVWPSREVQVELDDPLHHAWRGTQLSPTMAAHIVCHGPARVLREVEATRQIVEECARTLDNEDTGHWLARFVLRREALRFSHRPGYKAEEWAP